MKKPESKQSLFKIIVDDNFLVIVACICQGHGFPAKFVIHVNSPTSAQKDALTKIEEAVKNILTLADEKNLKSIALPSIGSGS